MSKFVVGQKVICESVGVNPHIKVNGVYTVKNICESGIYIGFNDDKNFYFDHRFRTIIQDTNDVVVGMELTYNESWPYLDFKNGDTVTVTNTVVNTTDPRLSWVFVNEGYPIGLSMFKEYTPKEGQKEEPKEEPKEESQKYNVIKPFTLLDIYESQECKACSEFFDAFEAILIEIIEKGEWGISDKFIAFSKNSVTSTMWKYRDEFEERGFIMKKVKDVVLRPGMRLLKKQYNQKQKYTVVESGDGSSFNGVSLVGDGHFDTEYGPYIFSYGKTYNKGTTLKELNDETTYDFELLVE